MSFSVRMSAFKKRRFQKVCVARKGSNKLIQSCGGQRVCVGRARVSKSLVGRKKFDIDKESVLKPNKLFGIAHCAVMMMYDIVSSGSSVNTITDAQCVSLPWRTRSGANSPVAKIETVLIWN